MPSELYISYDGIMEPLGQSQVVRYMERLSPEYSIHLISFEKSDDLLDVFRLEALKESLKRHGIKWTRLTYHKRPAVFATLLDILNGLTVAGWILFRHKIKIIHARSYVPSLIAVLLKKITNVSFIFDMRGFWADERVDGDIWLANSNIFRITKWLEKQFFINADYVVSLTNAAVDEIRTFPYLVNRMPKIQVITTCTDLKLFKPLSEVTSNARSFTLGYVGSVGVWYLFDEALRCFIEIKKTIPEAKLHIFNKGDHDYIFRHIKKLGIDTKSVLVESGDHTDVVNAMQLMDAGVFIIKPVYSKLASAPTKLGEFLGCGVPCLCNTNVGDMAQIVEKEGVGVALKGFSEEEINNSVSRFLTLIKEPDIKRDCRNAALKHFSLDDGVKLYNEIYQSLLN